MDFGFLLYSRMTVINAAREGARVATTMTGESADAIQGAVSSQVTAVAGGLAVTTDPIGCFLGPDNLTPCLDKPGNSIKVTVRYDHRVFFPLLFGATIPMSSTVQMVLE